MNGETNGRVQIIKNIRLLLFIVVNVCEERDGTLKCGDGQLLDIHYANWGSIGFSELCYKDEGNKEILAYDGGEALATLREKCDNAQECKFTASEGEFEAGIETAAPRYAAVFYA